jgi:hypothetical protein
MRSLLIKCKIIEITIYEPMTENQEKAHCKTIHIPTETVSKNEVLHNPVD